MSHPSRVRGLKLAEERESRLRYLSHPSRVRGLKLVWLRYPTNTANVAPFTGAWIEISSDISISSAEQVAPFTGAWIEIN